MHRLELDIGGSMKRCLLILLACIFLIVAPVSAQQQPPAPAPTLSAGAQTIIQTTTDAIDRYGLLNVAMFILLIAVVVIAVIAARSFVVPLMASNTAGSQQQILLVQQLATISQQGFRAQQDTAIAMQRMADSSDRSRESSERMANVLNTLESKHDSHEDRLMMSKEINTHTDETVKPVQEAADSTLKAVKDIEIKLDRLMTRDEFTEQVAAQLQPVRQDIAELRRTIEGVLLSAIQTAKTEPEAEPPKDSTSLDPQEK